MFGVGIEQIEEVVHAKDIDVIDQRCLDLAGAASLLCRP